MPEGDKTEPGYTIKPSKIIEFASVLGIVWGGVVFGWNYVGKPWATTLIQDTVDGRLDDLESKIQSLLNASKAETQQSIGEAETTREILCRLQAEQTGADPANCSSNARR